MKMSGAYLTRAAIQVVVNGARGALGIVLAAPLTPGQFLVKGAGSNARQFVGVTPPGAIADAVRQTDLAGANGGALVGIAPPDASGVPVSLQQIADERVSAFRFGAVGDGVHDDGPAIQAMMDWLEERGGGTGYLPPPPVHYRTTIPIEIGAHCALEGPKPARYPYSLQNALVADFANPLQWVVQAKVRFQSNGQPVPYNVMVEGAINTYTGAINATCRNLVIGYTGNRPYGALRMHCAPGAVVEGCAANGTGAGLLVNYCFGGRFEFFALTAYYGTVGWDDCNGNLFNVYNARYPGIGGNVPEDYLIAPMSAWRNILVSTYGLKTNAHYNRAQGILTGSTNSTSNTNVFNHVTERWDDAVVAINAYSTSFSQNYVESDADVTKTAYTLSRCNVVMPTMHAYLSGGGEVFDCGFGVRLDATPNGIIFFGSFGRIRVENESRAILRNSSPTDFGPAVPQYNVINEFPGGGGPFQYQNGASAVLGGGLDVVPRYLRDRGDTVLMGQINAPAGNVTLAQLAAGYRPGMRTFIPGGVITGDGQIIANAPGVLNLNCIRFPSGA